MNEAIARAKAKLERIIEREGSANGARLTPEYFDELLADVEREMEAERILFL